MLYLAYFASIIFVEAITIIFFFIIYNAIEQLERKAFVFINAISYSALCFMPILITLIFNEFAHL